MRKRLIMRTSIFAVLLIALGYTFYFNFFSDKDQLVRVGDLAPNFILSDLEGNKVELSDYAGKGVFLNFWGTYCPPCEKEMPYMENQYHIYKEKGVEILAVNVDEPELTVRRFVERHQLNFPILLDKGSELLTRYGVVPLPTTFLIDKDGNVTKIITGGMTEKDIAAYMESIKP